MKAMSFTLLTEKDWPISPGTELAMVRRVSAIGAVPVQFVKSELLLQSQLDALPEDMSIPQSMPMGPTPVRSRNCSLHPE